MEYEIHIELEKEFGVLTFDDIEDIIEELNIEVE